HSQVGTKRLASANVSRAAPDLPRPVFELIAVSDGIFGLSRRQARQQDQWQKGEEHSHRQSPALGSIRKMDRRWVCNKQHVRFPKRSPPLSNHSVAMAHAPLPAALASLRSDLIGLPITRTTTRSVQEQNI